jgi:hypothetical protein
LEREKNMTDPIFSNLSLELTAGKPAAAQLDR